MAGLEAADKFSAKDSVLGYFYQCRYALYLFLERSRRNPAVSIALEHLDDISLGSDVGQHNFLTQTKFHTVSSSKVTDFSPDLWKTIRVWAEQMAEADFLADDLVLTLVTTQVAQQGSAAEHLRPQGGNGGNWRAALAGLRAASKMSANKALMDSFSAFNALSESKQELLVQAIRVLDGAPGITELEELLEEQLRRVVERRYLKALALRTEGWWFSRVLAHWTSPEQSPIKAMELELFIDEMRNTLRHDDLPIDQELAQLEATYNLEALQSPFVDQLKLIEASPKRIGRAIQDANRAFAQRSRWTRDGLLDPGETNRYERKLVDEWQRLFAIKCESLPQDAAEPAKTKLGMEILNHIELEFKHHIRARCQDSFVMMGTYHSLADRLEAGWHPDFKKRMLELLDIAKAG